MIGENLQRVQERIAAAARSAGRDPSQVRLICVTKGVPVERVREAAAAGVREIGENRVQEAQEKQPVLGRELRWHLIGRLQSNKVKLAAGLFDVIHSVDSAALAETLEQHAARRPADREALEVFVQVNVSGEITKFGCAPEEAGALAHTMSHLAHLRVAGLMTIAHFSEDPQEARPHFRRLRERRDAMMPGGRLSMGMSHDFEVALEEGADVIRIGTAIFGSRP